MLSFKGKQTFLHTPFKYTNEKFLIFKYLTWKYVDLYITLSYLYIQRPSVPKLLKDGVVIVVVVASVVVAVVHVVVVVEHHVLVLWVRAVFEEDGVRGRTTGRLCAGHSWCPVVDIEERGYTVWTRARCEENWGVAPPLYPTLAYTLYTNLPYICIYRQGRIKGIKGIPPSPLGKKGIPTLLSHIHYIFTFPTYVYTDRGV